VSSLIRVIYRDLKPENIGFDVRDDVKIFDFGLAKEKSPADRIQGSDLYRLTNDTGSPRYMAPEVALGKPYNEKCDVYGFTLLLWQVIECVPPFQGYTFAKMKDVYTKNDRPKINPKWSDNMKNICTMGWNADVSNRPSLDELSEMIRKEIKEFGGDSDLDLTDRTEKSMRKLRL
jgi:serine/threonine protein kinase